MLIFIDGFDHYGVSTAGRTNMLAGVYAASAGSMTPSSSQPRTGAIALTASGGSGIARRVLGAARTGVGIGYAVFLNNLPGSTDSGELMGWLDAGAAYLASLTMDTTGKIRAKLGAAGGTLLGQTAAPVLVAGAYQHIEAFVKLSTTVGSIEVRVNEVTVLSLTGLNLGSTNCEQVTFAGALSGFVDDVFCWDDTGSTNNTFIGDRKVITLFPSADTAVTDWVAVGATPDFECINEAAPNGDTDYIVATPLSGPAKLSEFDYTNLPAGVAAVNGVQIYTNALKTDAGASNVQVSVISGASVAAGTDNPLTTAYTYRMDMVENDPATGAPWTPAAVDAMKTRIARTA